VADAATLRQDVGGDGVGIGGASALCAEGGGYGGGFGCLPPHVVQNEVMITPTWNRGYVAALGK
jgi:hypothetical protein